MEKQKVIWTRKAEIQLFSIMDYYAERNKSDVYSLKLENEINKKLSNINFTVSLPKKSSDENIYYVVYNHICAFFGIENASIIVYLVWDDRRNPKDLETSLLNF